MAEEPIVPAHREVMNMVAQSLDEIFNGDAKGHDRKVCFTLLITEFGKSEGGRVNYISNGERPDIISMMKELIARWEGRYAEGGAA